MEQNRIQKQTCVYTGSWFTTKVALQNIVKRTLILINGIRSPGQIYIYDPYLTLYTKSIPEKLYICIWKVKQNFWKITQ